MSLARGKRSRTELRDFPGVQFRNGAELHLQWYVTGIHVICDELCRKVSTETGTTFFNTWRIFLSFRDSHRLERSVALQVRVRKDSPTFDTVVSVRWMPYAFTTKYLCICTLRLNDVNLRTIDSMLRYLQSAGLFQYRFANLHQGGRFWIQSVVRHMELGGIVRDRSSANVVADTSLFYCLKKKRGTFVRFMPRDVTAGQFF